MDLTFSDQEEAFRGELREWLSLNHPGEAPAGEDAIHAWRRDFQRRMAADAWAAVHWPTEHGGRDATLTESAIFFEELGRADAPLPANFLGLLLAGPTIMAHGTTAQQERYLAPIVNADEIWCQGFSEPDAGSDLAAVKTRAVRDGNEWVVTGQKVWTSGAQYSKWCMLLARTDATVPKHKGLTYFLLDMEQEAVAVVPLRQITGEAHFNEVFLNEARVPSDSVLGGEGDGWRVALTTLMNERAGIAFFLLVTLRRLLDEVAVEVGARGLLADRAVADRIGRLHLQVETLRLIAYRGLTAIETHGEPGAEGALAKWMWSQTNQELTDLAVELLGPSALSDGGRWSYELLRARGNSIEGGTTEILKNILAERVLGLPKAR
jgi:alkylation response protein AidB-like acyl-CoA dehydrogenase